MIWHSSDLADMKQELGFDENTGLSSAEIAGRIHTYGENRLSGRPREGFAGRLCRRLSGFMIVFLAVVSLIMLITGAIAGQKDWYVPLLILLVLAVNAAVTALAESQSEKALSELSDAVSLSARVKRDGEVSVIDTAQLVPGDIVLLEAGDYIPADGRLLEAYSLICDESAVSGDAAPNEKQADAQPADICPLNERRNMVYSGCSVTFGHAVMVVTDTGRNTELGKQTALAEQTVGRELPVRKKLAALGRTFSWVVLALCALVFLIGLICGPAAGQSFSNLVLGMLITSAALAVAALPEAFPASVTWATAFTLRSMFRKKIVVKKRQAVETLGCVSVILSDKTGTLTENQMKLSMLYDGAGLIDLSSGEPGENGLTLIRTGALCCNGRVTLGSSGKQRHFGDPTEVGIVAACLSYCGLTKDEIENIYPRMCDVPFDSDRKLMTTVNMINNRPFAIVKGAPDLLMSRCTGGNLKGAAEAAEQMGQQGMRVIAVAIKPLEEVPANPNPDNMECDLSLLGLFGLTDTVTEETVHAIQSCSEAGIRCVMLTGDHITTAEAIGRQTGILREGMKAVTGEELAKMDDDQLAAEAPNIAVYSRITAEDKLRIVKAWQARGEVVALTGDSVEDALPLKEADVGCAMGVTGTDISKGAADLVLNDDSFVSIVEAVRQSRSFFANIRAITGFLLSSNLAELLIMLLGMLIFKTPPLAALPLLWINLITDFAPAAALCAEPPGRDTLRQSPRSRREGLFSGKQWADILWQGLLLGVLSLIAYAIGSKSGAAAATTMAFTVLSISEIVLAFNRRSEGSLFREGFHTNRPMLICAAAALTLVLFVVLTPIRGAFSMCALTAGGFWIAILLALVPLAVCEAVKIVRRLLQKRTV